MDQFFRYLDGRATGVDAVLIRGLLRGGAYLYGMAIAIRNLAYDRGWKKAYTSKIPVVSVGNITTGGTGKTPFVAFVVAELQRAGVTPGIVSRGYGADSSGVNDEKRVLDRLCPGVPHRQNAHRAASVVQLIEESGVDAIVMDDGFQHRAMARDFDIVLVDACNPFGFGYLLPRGLLREPVQALRRASLVLLTRCDLVSESDLDETERVIRNELNEESKPILRTMFEPTDLINLKSERRSVKELSEKPCWLMSGIGNPDAFQSTCQTAGLKIVGQSVFPDHHHYRRADIERVLGQARNQGAENIITTLKDLVKLPVNEDPIWALNIQPKFSCSSDEIIFRAALERIFAV